MSVRACLQRSRSGCETPHHQVDHGNPDPRLGSCRQSLIVFTQPPRAIEPAAWAFHHPAPLQDLKTSGVPGTFHDHASSPQYRRDPRDELASIPPIRPDQLESREAGDPCRQDLFGPVAVLHSSRMDDDDEEQPQDIDHDVALAPTDALASVIASDPPFSVICTVWLSIIPALGSRVRPEASRRSSTQGVVHLLPAVCTAPGPSILSQ